MNKQKLYNFIITTFDTKISPYTAMATFLAIILIRLGIENWISVFDARSPTFYLYEFLHTTLFFYLLFIICVILTVKIATISLKTSITIFLFGFLLIIFPPVIDWLISIMYFDGASFASYYLFDSPSGLIKSFVTFFGDKPRDGITYGTRIMIALSIFLLVFLTYIKTKKILRTIFMFIVSYIIFFLLSSLPSLITFVVSSRHLASNNSAVAALIASPTSILGNQILHPMNAINIKMSLIYMLISIFVTLLILFKTKQKTFISLIKNIRPIQTLYHLGLLAVGMGIAIIFANAVLLPSFFTLIALILLCIAIIFAWYSTVILNDCVDQDIDKISNPTRPLITKTITVKHYRHIGIFLGIFSITITAAINAYAALILIAYHAISFLYNTYPLRLKRFPGIATFLASIASFFVVVIGFITLSPEHSLNNFPPHIAILLIISYTISLPIKDLKDIEGDKANNIYTIPVIFGEKIARTIIATGIFISFMLSIFTLGTNLLLLPALLAGTLSFWTLVGRKNNKFIFTPVQTIAIVFLIVSLYAIILAISLFV